MNKTNFSSSKSLRAKYVSETKRKNVVFVGLGHLSLTCRICQKFEQVEASQNVDFKFFAYFSDSQPFGRCVPQNTKKNH